LNKSISNENRAFWDELCGTKFAQSLGIDNANMDSLDEYDEWYFRYYPYLFKHIPLKQFAGKDVLEIGLGFGSVSQRIIESDARYQGLDIARGPADIVNRRIQFSEGIGLTSVGSILDSPYKNESFDFIVSIGCFHHTGNMQGAIDECFRILKPSGKLILMVYNALSYRRFRMAFFNTVKYIFRELFGYRGVIESKSNREIAAYDTNIEGESAPHTDWVSIKSLKSYCSKFSIFSAVLENINKEFPFKFSRRDILLKTKLPKIMGLDIYAITEK